MFGKKISQIDIERKQVRLNEKREWVYILNRSKIVNKLLETIGNIEEFSNLPQPETPVNNLRYSYLRTSKKVRAYHPLLKSFRLWSGFVALHHHHRTIA